MLLAALILLLLTCAAAYLAIAVWSGRQRRRLGLGGGRVTAADDSRLGSPTLRSERLGLVARPDHVLEVGGMRTSRRAEAVGAPRLAVAHAPGQRAMRAGRRDLWGAADARGAGACERAAATGRVHARAGATPPGDHATHARHSRNGRGARPELVARQVRRVRLPPGLLGRRRIRLRQHNS